MLTDVFRRVVHVIMLVWKHSKHYNTPARLVVENMKYLDAAERVAAIRRDVPIPHLHNIVSQPIPTAASHPQTWESLLAEWGVQRFAQGAVG